MADNVNLTAGDGTIVAGTDTIGGVSYPRAKVVWGPDGTVNDTDVATGKPLPVQLRTATGTAIDPLVTGTAGTASTAVVTVQGIASGTVVPVSGTVTANAGTNLNTSALATVAKQPALGIAGTASTDVITVQGIASGVAQPVSMTSTTITGTVAATESGTWTVQPGNTANTTAWKVDDTAAWDKGAGTGGSVTQRILVDSSQLSTLGQAVMASSMPVVIASNQSAVPITDNSGSLTVDNADITSSLATLGATADAAATQGSTGSISAKLRTVTSQLNILHTDSADFLAGEYETVAASQTTQTLGATGATGDYLESVLVIPSSVNPGAVQIKDGSNSAITIFVGGTASLTDLAPIYIGLGLKSTSGAWQVTTGANETAIGIGNFT